MIKLTKIENNKMTNIYDFYKKLNKQKKNENI